MRNSAHLVPPILPGRGWPREGGAGGDGLRDVPVLAILALHAGKEEVSPIIYMGILTLIQFFPFFLA